MGLICDTLRSAAMNYDDPHQVEESLDKRMESYRHHAEHSTHALQSMADGLPALGSWPRCLASSRRWRRSISRPLSLAR